MVATLIGSRAMNHWYPDSRKPRDADVHTADLITADVYAKEGYDVFTDLRLAQWEWDTIATPDELYTMKISHSFWVIGSDENWNKHASDILFLKSKGAVFIRELYDILLPIWKDLHNKHITNLNQTAGEFFKDGVKRKYDYDSVHASIAYGDHPLYEDILREGSEVMVDNAKFWAMDYETQLLLVREEIMATALERILIPNDLKGSPSRAYHWALRRTATSLFKNEWALFLMLNYDRLARPDCDYVARHKANADKLILLED